MKLLPLLVTIALGLALLTAIYMHYGSMALVSMLLGIWLGIGLMAYYDAKKYKGYTE